MIIAIAFWISVGLSLIFNGFLENILIILATTLIYTYFMDYKEYKSIILGFFVSFIIINLSIIIFIRDDINLKDIELGEAQSETLVMLVYDGEDRNYNVGERANEIYYEEGYKSYITSVYGLYKHKNYYEKLGSSEFKDTTYEIESKLRDRLGEEYRVISSYMYTKPYFENTIQEAIYLGYREIIICPMFITQGKDFELFKTRIDKLELSKYGIDIKLADVLYKSNDLAKAYKDAIVSDINNKKIDAGVLLVGLEDENNLEQDIIFREKIKHYIEEEKNKQIQIKLPLLENNKNDIIKSGEELLEYGIDILYIVIPTCTIDNMHNKYLVETILQELDYTDTKFCYIDPKDKVNILVEEIYTQISLIKH
ncbi:MAG: hypothetical protein ACRCXT_07275 [Paraclostridium sp.]